MAGFEVIIYGRFWVIAEGAATRSASIFRDLSTFWASADGASDAHILGFGIAKMHASIRRIPICRVSIS